jgi:microsomal dipeptidase-like Zn-dependent dipeptidase
VQINFAAGFLDPDFPALDPKVVEAYFAAGDFTRKVTDHRTPLRLLVDHFDHALQTIGADHVGIGSDFDGVPALPVGMEDCSRLPYLTAELLRRGYGEDELLGVLGGNILRVMDACADVARTLQG